MNNNTSNSEYYIFIRRNFEATWYIASKHTSHQKAEAALAKMRSFSGMLSFSNAQLLLLSRSEAQQEFGTDWEEIFIKRDTNRMITRDCTAHVVENPCGMPMILFQRTYYYWRPTGQSVGSGWYFYYERPNGEMTQLFGPYETGELATKWSESDAFRYNINHLWRPGITGPSSTGQPRQ